MIFRFNLLFLPAFVLAEIDIYLTGDFKVDASNLKVFFSGYDSDWITNTERNTFNLTDDNLKNGINLYYGKRPDDVYLRNPTSQGDLYETYHWSQIARFLKPITGRILHITSESEIIFQQIFENRDTKEGTVYVDVSREVQNSVRSFWSKEGELSVCQNISYIFDINLVESGDKTSISYTSYWDNNITQLQTKAIGSKLGMELVLTPGQSAVTQLHVNKTTVQIEMVYEASLSGQIAVYYGNRYQGHYFHDIYIVPFMYNASLNNQIMSKEIINYEFYRDSKVVVQDVKTGRKLMEVPF